MLKYFPFLLIFVFSCKIDRLYQKKEYHQVVLSTSEKLNQNPGDLHYQTLLMDSYIKSQNMAKERISQITGTDISNHADELYNLYNEQKIRQEAVKQLFTKQNYPAEYKENFKIWDIDSLVLSHKKMAAELHYESGKKLLCNQEKYLLRQAYNEFQQVRKYFTDYKNLDSLIKICDDKGNIKVLIQVKNFSGGEIPETFKKNIFNFPLKDKSRKWITLDKDSVEAVQYDYLLNLIVINYEVFPDKTEEVVYDNEKIIHKIIAEIDTTGKKIKINQSDTISATVTETMMSKNIKFLSYLEFIDNHSQNCLRKAPVFYEESFRYNFAKFTGDPDALTTEVKKLIKKRKVPFPDTQKMLENAAESMKSKVRKIIKDNISLFGV